MTEEAEVVATEIVALHNARGKLVFNGFSCAGLCYVAFEMWVCANGRRNTLPGNVDSLSQQSAKHTVARAGKIAIVTRDSVRHCARHGIV